MDKIVKIAIAAMQPSSTNEFDDDDDLSEDKDQSLMAEENSDLESEDLLALIANSDSKPTRKKNLR